MDLPELRRRLERYGQEHVLAWWDRLSEGERRVLAEQVRELDLDQLQSLYARRDEKQSLPEREQITPIARPKADAAEAARDRQRGVEAWKKGEVSVLIVAGGQGSRLGFDHPKGMFPIGPVSGKSLFEIHAEKVLALSRRYGQAVPLLVMTSPATHAETEVFFKQHRFFGLPPTDVAFFCQGTMPALDLQTGRLLMESPGRLFTSPNGHGGALLALAGAGLLKRLGERGIRTIFYFQVDNPLVDLADQAFLGRHLNAQAELSSKVVGKETPEEKLGIFVLVDGRLTIIEYSDLPDDLARQTEADGRLRFWAGNPAIHLFQVDFLDRITRQQTGLPWHVARKKVPCLDQAGNPVEPQRENALKFEMFIFDAFPKAPRWTLVPTERQREFHPLKNATGADSPATVQQGMSNLAAAWLARIGIEVPRTAAGDAAVPLEISPLFALDEEELAAKVSRGRRIEGPTFLG
jgi:UDP-N-acetylglucosamine/UDP-N-acetylgalactosamine diphosphorylase